MKNNATVDDDDDQSSERANDRSIVWTIRIRSATEPRKRIQSKHTSPQQKSNKQHNNNKKYQKRCDQSTRIGLRIPTHHIKQSWLSGRQDRKTQSGLKMWRKNTREKKTSNDETKSMARALVCTPNVSDAHGRSHWLRVRSKQFLCSISLIFSVSFRWSRCVHQLQ